MGFHLMDPDKFEAPHLPTDASPTALSLGYVVDFDPLYEDPADYPIDKGDDDEERRSPPRIMMIRKRRRMPLRMTRMRRRRSTKALITKYAFAPTPPSPPPSPLSPLTSPLHMILSSPLLLPPPHTSPTYASAPLGYRAVLVQLRAAPPLHVPSLPLHVPTPPLLLPSSDHRSDIPEADMLFQKRLYLTTPASRFEVWESLTTAITGQTRHTLARRVDYEFIDTLDASI
uniref:Uncharacterized protein n=1 Tax=Tanacetum cinerariifolium TaxID=118510 RepID=A0A6L2MDA2_TANCI|nr:hypothetical protein [Tanacetum cinerariifolium]